MSSNCGSKRLCYDWWKKFFDLIKKDDFRTYKNIWKIAIEKFQGDDYTTGYLLDYPYFKEYYQLIAVDLSKQ